MNEDPRIEPLTSFYEDGSLAKLEELGFATRAIALVDAADSAAGYVRIDITDPAVHATVANLIAEHRDQDVSVDESARLVLSYLENVGTP
jgi:hypothetical protein